MLKYCSALQTFRPPSALLNCYCMLWRPLLSSCSELSQLSSQNELAEKYAKALIHGVEPFIKLHTLSIFVTRSWAIIHNDLSSAHVLALIGITKDDPNVRRLQAMVLASYPATRMAREISTTRPTIMQASVRSKLTNAQSACLNNISGQTTAVS